MLQELTYTSFLLLHLTEALTTNAASSLFGRSVCEILPAPQTGQLIGESPCSWGVVDTAADCICCPDGVTPCQSVTQTCQQVGIGYTCVENYSTASVHR